MQTQNKSKSPTYDSGYHYNNISDQLGAKTILTNSDLANIWGNLNKIDLSLS